VEWTSTEVYIDRIGGQHRQGYDGDRIWLYVINCYSIKGNNRATGEDVDDPTNQWDTTRVTGRKKMENASKNDRPTAVNVNPSAISRPTSRSRNANQQQRQTDGHSEVDVTARKATRPQEPSTGGGRQTKV